MIHSVMKRRGVQAAQSLAFVELRERERKSAHASLTFYYYAVHIIQYKYTYRDSLRVFKTLLWQNQTKLFDPWAFLS